MARRLIVEIVGDSSSLQAALGRSAAAADGFGGKMQSIGDRMSSLGHKLTRDVTLPVAAIGAVSVKSAIDFQSSMEMLHTQAGVSQGAIEGLSKAVLGMAGTVATGPEELTTGLYHLASQGLRGKQALDALRTAAEGAKVGQANLEDVTNALGAVLVSHIGGFKNYTEAMGQLNAVVGSGDMHMQDLADAMGTGLPAKAAVAGVSLRDVGAALAVLGDNNIRGAEAGTLLNSTLRLMEGPSKAAAKAMGQIGLNASQFGNTLRSQGLVAAVEDLRTHLSGLSKADQFAALTHMFGGRQAGGVMILIDQLERLKQKEKEVADGGGKFASDWEAYTKTTAYHLASMGAQMQAAGITIGDVLLPVVAKIADVIGSLATKFESLSGPVKTAILVFAGVAAAIGPVLSVIGSLTTVIGFLVANPITLLIAGIAALVAGIVAAVIWPDKLRDVLEKMGLSASTAGDIVKGLQDVFHVVAQAGQALVSVITSNWSTIKSIVSGAVNIVSTIIRDFIAVTETLWRTFGSTLTSAAETYWGYVKNTIHNALDAIKGVIDLVLGIIHGNWSEAWKGLKEIVSAIFAQIQNVLRTAVSLLGDLAKLIGEAIWKGIIKPIAHLAAELLQKIEAGILSAVHTITSWVVGIAGEIGHSLVHGIVGGVTSLPGELAGKLKSGIDSAIHFAGGLLHGSGEYQFTRHTVGKPLAEGIIIGYLEGINPLGGKISQSLRTALEQAKATIKAARSDLATEWSQLAKDANTALASILNPKITQAGGLLAGLTSTQNTTDLHQQFTKAAADLADAQKTAAAGTTDNNGAIVNSSATVVAAFQSMQQAYDAVTAANEKYGVSSKQAVAAQEALMRATAAAQDAVAAETGANKANDQAVVDAQNTMNSLLYQQAQTSLQARAKMQEAHRKAELAAERASLAASLKELEKHLAKVGATHRQAEAAIVKLLKSYGISYQEAGKSLGEAFANGIESTISKAAAAAAKLAKEVSRYLPHSPAEKGPLSKLPGWEDYLTRGIPGATAAAANALASGLARPGLSGTVGAAGGGGLTIQVSGNTLLGDDMEIAQQLADKVEPFITRRRVAFASTV